MTVEDAFRTRKRTRARDCNTHEGTFKARGREYYRIKILHRGEARALERDRREIAAFVGEDRTRLPNRGGNRHARVSSATRREPRLREKPAKIGDVRLSGIHVALKEDRIIFAPPLERGRRGSRRRRSTKATDAAATERSDATLSVLIMPL